jgi:hypothetical protein
MYSTFIKDLMDIPSDSPLDSAPIYLNQATHFVRKFVDLIYCSNSSNVRISFKDHMALSEICDQLHCNGVDEAIWTATKLQLEEMGKSPGFTAWETFKVAALRNDGKTAAKAIRSFEQFGKEFDYISLKSRNTMMGSRLDILVRFWRVTFNRSTLLDLVDRGPKKPMLEPAGRILLRGLRG